MIRIERVRVGDELVRVVEGKPFRYAVFGTDDRGAEMRVYWPGRAQWMTSCSMTYPLPADMVLVHRAEAAA